MMKAIKQYLAEIHSRSVEDDKLIESKLRTRWSPQLIGIQTPFAR